MMHGASLWNFFRAEAPRNCLLDHVNGGRTQGKLGEDLCPGEKLAHNSRPHVLLRDNDGVAWIEACVLEAGRKNRLARIASGHRSIRPQNKDLSMVRIAVRAACQMEVLANASAVAIQKRILIEHGANHLNGGGSGRDD